MRSETLKATDNYSAKNADAPRVSLKDMEDKINAEYFFTAGQAVSAVNMPAVPELDLLTICILVMKNGFTIIGKSAPASPENFDPEKGKRFAYEDAIKQLWPMEGYALRERLTDSSRFEADPYADQSLRRGLNKPLEDSANV